MTLPLTRRQQQILDFLRDTAADGEPPPNLNDVCRAFGLRSRGSLHRHIQALVAAGFVEPMNGKQRGLRLTPSSLPDGTLPLRGRIAAGRPLEAIERAEPIAAPAWMHGSGTCYLLEVHGESMRDDGILDGDLVVIDGDATCRDGQVVVALIDGSEVTLKRVETRGDHVRLHPANAQHDAIDLAAERLMIQGVVVGQMRRY